MEKRILAGLLIVFAFISAFVEFLILMIVGSMEVSYFAREYYGTAIITLLLGIISLIGAYFSITGKSWGLALTGSVFAILSSGVLFTGSVLGIVALVLIAISRDEFNRKPIAAPQYVASQPQAGDYGGTLPGYRQPP